MTDLKRVWFFLVGILHAIFVFVDHFSRRAPVGLGYGIIVFAILIKVYQERRRFNAGPNAEADWDPRYGDILYAKSADLGLTIIVRVAVFFGIMVLWAWYLPVLFEDVAQFLIVFTA